MGGRGIGGGREVEARPAPDAGYESKHTSLHFVSCPGQTQNLPLVHQIRFAAAHHSNRTASLANVPRRCVQDRLTVRQFSRPFGSEK